MNDFALTGASALVTGASGYLGRHMCRALGESGARLLMVGRDEAKLNELTAELTRKGIHAESFVCDLLEDDSASRIKKWVTSTTGALDILVNNAHGIRPGSQFNPKITDFQDATRFAISLPYALSYELSPLLHRGAEYRGHGASIIQISSIYGVNSPQPELYEETGLNSPPHYGAAKAGMLQMTRHLASHLARYKIRVNSLVLGPFPSKQIRENHPEFISRLDSRIPLGRCGNPNEIAGPLIFLASSASSFCTGASLHVDGGWTIW